MKKPFGMFIDLIYYGGYFERGYYNKEEFPAKPLFVLKLLKASVEKPGEISFSRSSINGFIGGNSITAVGKALMEAGYKEDKLSDYIKSLYKQEHKKTKPYNEKYGATAVIAPAFHCSYSCPNLSQSIGIGCRPLYFP